MENLPNLNNGELDILYQAHKEFTTNRPEGKAFPLDPSNPQHIELIKCVLSISDPSQQKYPYLYKLVQDGQFSPEQEADEMIIATAGLDATGRVTAMTWLSNYKGTLYSGASLFVLDGGANQLLAYGSNTDVQCGMMRNYTSAQISAATNEPLKILGVNHMVDQDGIPRFTAIAGERDIDAVGQSSQNTLEAPVISIVGHDSIHIAVGRNSSVNPDNDADYYYSEAQPTDTPNLIIPFVGTFSIPYPIDTSKPIGFISNIYVDYATSSSEVINLTTNVTTQITSGGTLVKWNFPYDKQPAATTQSLVYQNGDANDKLSAVFFQFTVPLAEGAPSSNYPFTICSNPGPDTFPTSSMPLPDMKFWWHCLAEGTKVTLADGTLINIEDLHNGHRVLSGIHGGDLGVEATILANHKSTEKQEGKQGVYRLRTKKGKKGKEIIATGAHPVMTPTGSVMICYLKAGDQILVAEGVSTVESCEAIAYSGMFYDLKLGNAADRVRMGQHPINSYHANGILVGDHLAMNAQADRQRYDLDFILPRIKKDFHTDYINAVKDRKS